ncbi:MAG: hypothetical protein MGG11_17835 [Trichodesmium sp. MAG_R03]|nr:hypothetical protein [Trichodesmium sp. MAG_R03]
MLKPLCVNTFGFNQQALIKPIMSNIAILFYSCQKYCHFLTIGLEYWLMDKTFGVDFKFLNCYNLWGDFYRSSNLLGMVFYLDFS